MSISAATRPGLTKCGPQDRFDRLLTYWHNFDTARDNRAAVIFICGLLAICGTTALTGAVPTKMCGHDVFVALGMGWRVINGQRPHVDFASGWGPVWFLITALGLKISRYSVEGIGYANAIVAVIVGNWSFLLARGRLFSSWRILLSLFLAALVCSPYALGFSPLMSTHAMVYNRYGYALLGLVMLECFEEARDSSGNCRNDWIGGGSTGAALSLTLFLKASFFLVDLGLVAILSLLLRRLRYRRMGGLLAGFSFVSLCLLADLRFDLVGMIRDLRMAGAARYGLLTWEIFLAKLMTGPLVLLGLVLFAFLAGAFFGNRAAGWRGSTLMTIGILLFAADMSLMLTNAQWGGFPICAVYGILMGNEITRHWQTLPQPEARRNRALLAEVLFLAALLFLPLFASDMTGLAYGLWDKERTPTEGLVIRFTTPNLEPLLLYDGRPPRSNGRIFTTYVNDGIALLTRESRPDEKILSMDMTNPFPYALERKPPHGGIASPTYHFNLDDAHRPSDDEFFGDADIVMVPKNPALDDFFYKGFMRAYGPGLHRRYQLVAQSNWWWMYRKK